MGLISLWDSLTGARVREIAPQTECSWLDKHRPQTSASSRTAKNLRHLNLKPSGDNDCQPATPHEGRKKKRTLSISRPKLLEATKKERQVSGAHGADTPAVPAISLSPLPRHSKGSSQEIRPRTANTASSSMCTAERFQWADHGLPSPTFNSPLPSPLSATSPISPVRDNNLRSNDEPIQIDGNSRKRSNSTASGKPKLKRALWLIAGKTIPTETDLPPPLPPPSGPLPELPNSERYMQRRVGHDSTPEASTSPVAKSSLDGDSILNAFPPVPIPNPTGESSRTLEAALRNSTITLDSILQTSQATKTMSDSDAERLSPVQSNLTSSRPMASLDGMLAPELPPKDVPKHDSKQLPPLPPEATAKPELPDVPGEKISEDSKSVSSSEELQQEYDRLRENVGQQSSPGAVSSVIEELNSSTYAEHSLNTQKFSNEEALSRLEFGPFK